MMIWIWLFALILLSVIIYCLSQRKWLLAIVMTLFLVSLLVIAEQYKKTITVAKFELFEQYLLINYKNQSKKIIYYKDISDLRHYCKGKSNLSGCGIAIYTEDDRIELQEIPRDVDSAKQLKAQIFAKMNRRD